jgi:hypothetical protein
MFIINLDKRIVRVIFILTYSLLLFSVVTKLFCIPYISEKFHALGISGYCRVFGVVELLAVCAFIYPRTIGIGLMMLCSYFGGAIATDIHSPHYLYQPIVVLLFVLTTALLKKPSLFHESIKIPWNEHP